jgi:hypothetical protein
MMPKTRAVVVVSPGTRREELVDARVPPGKEFFAPALGMRTVESVGSVAPPGVRASPPPGTSEAT